MIVVVGAGPAGCAAAIRLAEAGGKVVLLEKCRLPRYKTCGGGILRRAFRMLPSSVGSAIEHECRVAELNYHGLRFVTRRTDPIVYMTMRSELDFMLVRHAQALGVDLREDCTVRGLQWHADSVSVHTDAGTFRADFVIAADGATGTVARAAGWGPLVGSIPALEWEVIVPNAVWSRFAGVARFDFGVPQNGYAWVFPKRAHLSVGVLRTRRSPINLPLNLDRYLKICAIDPVGGVQRHGYVIPVRPRRGPLAKDRVLLVGDAAGLADPVTAEGITHALESGRIAARAVIEGPGDAADVADRFERLLRNGLLSELASAGRLSRLLYDWPRFSHWVFRKHGSALSEMVTDIVMGERTYAEVTDRLLKRLWLPRWWRGLWRANPL